MITTALKQLKQERSLLQQRVQQLDTAIAALSGGRTGGRAKPGPKPRQRRKMSAAARARIGAAKKAWWAAKRRSAK